MWVELGYGQGWVWFGDEVRDGAEFGVRSGDETGVVLEDRGGVKGGVEVAGDLCALTLPSLGFLKPVHCSPLEVHIPDFCVGAPAAYDPNLPLRACIREHVLRTGQLPR